MWAPYIFVNVPLTSRETVDLTYGILMHLFLHSSQYFGLILSSGGLWAGHGPIISPANPERLMNKASKGEQVGDFGHHPTQTHRLGRITGGRNEVTGCTGTPRVYQAKPDQAKTRLF